MLPISNASLPAEVRNGTTQDKKDYKSAQGFEQMLVGQLVQSMVGADGTSAGADQSGDSRMLDRSPEAFGKFYLRLPAERDRQGFQFSRATSPLNGVQLNFPHNRSRDARPFRKLTLPPAKLTYAVADNPGDRSPVFFRHAFRHASSSAFRFQCRH